MLACTQSFHAIYADTLAFRQKKPAQGAGESILLEGGGDKRNYNDIFPLKKILIGNT